MKSRAVPHIIALITVFMWGITFICTKVLLRYMSPADIQLARTVLGFLTLFLVHPRVLRVREWKHELLFALAGLTGVFGYFLAENTALEFADASFVSVAVSTAPLFTAALSFILLKEKGFCVRFVVGFLIAISGIALISFQGGPAHVTALGVVLCLVCAVTWALYSIIVKRLSNIGYETAAMTKRSLAWGLLFMVVTRLIMGGEFPVEALAQPAVLGNLAFLGILVSGGCFITWSYCVKHLGAASASAYIYLQPAITVVAAVLILGEPLTVSIVLGMLLVMAGLILSEGFDRQIIHAVRFRR